MFALPQQFVKFFLNTKKTYTYNEYTTPPRITDIRSVIADIDKKIEEQVKE